MFSLRQSPLLTSRIKFKIQDLIDLYEKDWAVVLNSNKSVKVMGGQHYQYVRKDSEVSNDSKRQQ